MSIKRSTGFLLTASSACSAAREGRAGDAKSPTLSGSGSRPLSDAAVEMLTGTLAGPALPFQCERDPPQASGGASIGIWVKLAEERGKEGLGTLPRRLLGGGVSDRDT